MPENGTNISGKDDEAVVGDNGSIEVTNDTDAGRYEARVGGRLAGWADYRVREGRVVFTHTEVDDAFEGQGVGSTLVREALDDVGAGERQVVIECPFIRSWIERHEDYQHLLAP